MVIKQTAWSPTCGRHCGFEALTRDLRTVSHAEPSAGALPQQQSGCTCGSHGRRQAPASAEGCALCRRRPADPAGPGRSVQTGQSRPRGGEEGRRSDEVRVRDGRAATTGYDLTVAARASAPLCPTGTLRGRGGHSEEGVKRQARSDHGACHGGDALHSSGPDSSSPPPPPSYSSSLSPGSGPPGPLAPGTPQLKLRLRPVFPCLQDGGVSQCSLSLKDNLLFLLSTESLRLPQLFPSVIRENVAVFFSVSSIKKYFHFVIQLPLLYLLHDFNVILPSQSCHVCIFLIWISFGIILQSAPDFFFGTVKYNRVQLLHFNFDI